MDMLAELVEVAEVLILLLKVVQMVLRGIMVEMVRQEVDKEERRVNLKNQAVQVLYYMQVEAVVVELMVELVEPAAQVEAEQEEMLNPKKLQHLAVQILAAEEAAAVVERVPVVQE